MKSENNRRIVMAVIVAGLLVISVLTAATVGVSKQARTEATAVEEDMNSESRDDLEIDRDELLSEMNRDPTDPAKKLDVLDPELTELLSGSEVSDEELSSSEEILTDPYTRDQHNVTDVHDMGFTGEGVKVSLMDTGFDMAHPDLAGQHAVFEYNETTMDPEMEMYDGYPIAFDPVSMADYAYDGNISQDYTNVFGEVDNSWYVNTTYNTTTYENGTGAIVADYTDKEENVTYAMPDGVGQDEAVRFGLHPDDKLKEWYGERPAVLLTQNAEGNWTNVYVDLLNDREFVKESGAWIDGDDPDSEVISRDLNEDGIADVSGGMLYFASNGEMPIPYSQNFRETMNKIINLNLGYPPGTVEGLPLSYEDAWHAITGQDEIHTTPEDGEMIALMGDFNGFGTLGAHGTWTASAVAGQGVTGVPGSAEYPPGTPGEGLPRGMAPNATIIPMGRFFDAVSAENPLGNFTTTYSSTFFTADGYTGDPTITSDSADIASSSFGSTVGKNHGGFNFFERLFDYVGTQYTNNTLFVNSEGNEGSGFGTVSAPSGAQGVLSVGATGNQHYRVDPWNAYDGGPNPWPVDGNGEVTGMTSTGPHSMGSHGPDIMTNGQFGYGGDPINQQLDKVGGFQGSTSWTLWSGTSLSAPNAAGISALVYEAYEEAHGESPDSQTLKNIIMQGADDLKNSAHSQGPGEANAYESVMIAQLDGLYSGESEWRPGTNPGMGDHVEHHVNMMEAGDTRTDTLTLHNWNETEDIDYEMNAYKQEKVGETEIELGTGMDTHVPLIMINETGVYKLEDDGGTSTWEIGEKLKELDDPNADLFRLGAHTPQAQQSPFNYNLVEFYNWEDVDGNGSFDGSGERNRIGYAYNNLAPFGYDLTSDYFTIHDAMERSEDGIVVQARNYDLGYGIVPFDFTLNIEQYNQTEWDWIDIDAPTGTIGAEEELDYDLTADVPNDAIKGIYGGKLMIEDTNNGRTHPIPITITVGESTDLSTSMHFGAAEGEDTHGIYRNDRLYGSWEGGLTGDWRFYTFDLQNDITDRDVKLELEFDDEMSDMSAYLLGGAEHDGLELAEKIGNPNYEVDPFSDPTWDMRDRYGVNTLETHNETDIDQGDYLAFTRDEMEAGTYMIALQSHQISGYEPHQEFNGTLSATNVKTHREAAEVVGPDAINFQGEVLNIPAGEPYVNASFRYRMVGDSDWNQTENVTVDAPGDYDVTVDGLEEGTYEWKAVTQWNPENTGVVGEPITLQDLSAMVNTYPAEGDIVQGDSLTIEAEMTSDFDGELVNASVDLGGWFQQDAEIDTDYAWVDVPAVLSEGDHTYEFYLEDNNGNEHTAEVTFEVDTTAPMLQITGPEGGNEELTYDDHFYINGTTEPDAQLWVDGEVVDLDENGNFTYETNLTEGQNVFTVVAEDEAGNTAEMTVDALYLPDYEEIQEIRDALDDYLTESEINDILEDYVTEGNLTEALDDYMTESEINDVLDDYVTEDNLTDALEDYLTETEINDVLEEYVTEGNLTEALKDYMNETEINDVLEEYVTEGDLTDTLDDYMTESEINDALEEYVTEGNLTDALDDYMTESEINDVLEDYVTEDNLTDALEDYLTETEINDVLEEYVTDGDLTEALSPYMNETEINELLEGYVDEDNLTEALEPYLTDEEINDLLEDYISSDNLTETLNNYLTEEGVEEVLESLEDGQEDQDDDIAMARNLGLIGMILAILAIIIAVVAMQKEKPAEEEGPMYQEEEEYREEEEDMFEE